MTLLDNKVKNNEFDKFFNKIIEKINTDKVEIENKKFDNKNDGKVIKNLAKSNNLSICRNFLLYYLFQF